MTREAARLEESRLRLVHWKRWGPYLSERAWGTVREDYSADGEAWDHLTHEQARSKAYRWGEDGIAGLSDRHQLICFALALWNGRDPFLKERLFGLTGNQGNHGEDVKECYYYLDSTPTHSYMRFLYKYPQAEFPYRHLIDENEHRGRDDPEYELFDTGVFDEDRYFDVFVEYAKATHEDILIRIEAWNRGPDPATLHLLPTIWFRNTWTPAADERRPQLRRGDPAGRTAVVVLDHHRYGRRWLVCGGAPDLLFTENETNARRLYGSENGAPYVKDGIGEHLVGGAAGAINPEQTGTKAAAVYKRRIQPGESATLKLRFTDRAPAAGALGVSFDRTFSERQNEASEFYSTIVPRGLSADARNVMRQALAGLLWSKQFYYYDVSRWLTGDPGAPAPPSERLGGRNAGWTHLYNADILSMPDTWEYPWYATWDLAFHTIPLAMVDPDFAKEQLVLLLREWYMHPSGQLPAYEWNLSDANPPVHAWAAWRVYKIDKKRCGVGDRGFLERVFHKLLLNFTWWVNRKDVEGKNVFQGGFLGLDNIGPFDRSSPLPTGGQLEQSDATSWMGMYCLNMLAMALELARENRSYADVASKFFEHFVYICKAMNQFGADGVELWDRRDGFYYDVVHLPDGAHLPLRVRSMVGLIPLFAVETLDSELIDQLPGFKRRMQWFIDNRPELAAHIESRRSATGGMRHLLALTQRQRLRKVLETMLDEGEFLAPHGVRSLSRAHLEHPFELALDGKVYRVGYEPGEARTPLFGGNSNWRGPIWFPVNFLIIEALQKFHYYLGDEYTVELPSGSGRQATLWEVASELSRRLSHLFLRGDAGRRPMHGSRDKLDSDPHWRDLLCFYEYFDGDTGAGLGACHQTGWTALVAKLLQQSGE